MKKTTRVSLLVFTLVAAILAFGVLWYTRPGAPSYVLQEAKARQGIPLLEVTTTAKQTPPIEINLDYNTITAKVKENLVGDAGFSSVMAKSVSSSASLLVEKKMDSFRTEFDNKLFDQQASILKQLNNKIDLNYNELVSQLSNPVAYQDQIDLINTKLETVNKNIDRYAAKVNDPSNYSVDISSYIPQIVDSIIPKVTSNILTTIDDNKETIFSEIYDMSNNSISEDEAVAIYIKYRADIVRDLTPTILDNIEAQVKETTQTKMDNIVVEKPQAIEPFTAPVVVESAMDTTIPEVVVPSKPTFNTAPVIAETEPKVIRTNTINIIAVSDGSSIQDLDKTSDKTISMPKLVETPSVLVMDPIEYEAQRQALRDKAIEDILTFIK